MPKPGGCHSSGISLGDVLRLPKRHPAWRRREAQSGSCMERENLAGGRGAQVRQPQLTPTAADCYSCSASDKVPQKTHPSRLDNNWVNQERHHLEMVL